VLGIVNSEIVKVTELLSISFCTFSSVTFTISPLTIPNTSVLISISFCTFSSATFTISPLTIPNASECTERNRYQHRSVRDS
jgi:hypothetical protein